MSELTTLFDIAPSADLIERFTELLVINDAIWTLSVHRHGTITESYEEQARRARQAHPPAPIPHLRRPHTSPEPILWARLRLTCTIVEWGHDATGDSVADEVETTLFIVVQKEKFESVFSVLPEFWGDPPYSTVTAVGVTWLAGFTFEIKVVAKLPEARNG